MRIIVFLLYLAGYASAFDWQSDVNSGNFTSESHPSDGNNIRKENQNVTYIQDGNWIAYQNFDFGAGVEYIWIEGASTGPGGAVELRLGSPSGALIGSVAITNTGGWNAYQPFGLKITQPAIGVQNLYLKCVGGGGYLFNLAKFRFQRLAPDYKPADSIVDWVNPVLSVGMNSAIAFSSESNPTDDANVRKEFGRLAYIKNGNWISYENFDFGTGANYCSILGGAQGVGGKVELRLGGPTGTLIGTATITTTGGYDNFLPFGVDLSQTVTGVNDIYLKFVGGGGYLYNLAGFRFSRVGPGPKSYGRMVAADQTVQESNPGSAPVTAANGGISELTDSSWVSYGSFDFGTNSDMITIEAATPGKGGAVEVRLASVTGPLVAIVDVTYTGSWTHYRPYTAVFTQKLTGIQNLCFKFVDTCGAGGNLFNLKSFAVGAKTLKPAEPAEGQVKVYDSVPGLTPSPYYTYSVQKVSALNNPQKELATNWSNPFAWFTECPEPGSVAAVAGTAYFSGFIGGWSHTYCNFELDRNTPIVVKITRKTVTGAPSGPVFMANVHPAHKVISCEIINGDVYVTMKEPALVTVDIDGQLDTRDAPRATPDTWDGGTSPYNSKMKGAHAVSIFANPVIQDKPAPGAPGVRTIEPGQPLPSPDDQSWTTLYFKPGIHNISLDANGQERPFVLSDQYPLRSNKNYYIPGDAVVYGNFKGGDNSNENIRVFGHGTLSGFKIPHFQDYTGPGGGGNFRMIDIFNAINCNVEGVTIADPAEHGVYILNYYASHIQPNSMRWLKNISWRVNNDTGSANGVMEDCFFRHQDDGVYFGAGAVVRRCAYWSDVNGCAFRGSFVLRDKVPEITTMFPREVVFEDCDIIYARGMFLFTGGTNGIIGASDGMSNALYGDGTPNTGQHIVFRNFRVTDPRPLRTLLGFNFSSTDPAFVGMAGLRFENVEYRHPQTWGWQNHLKPSAGGITNWYFDRVSINGKQMDASMLADPSLFVTSNVSDMIFREPRTEPTPVYNLLTSSTNGSITLNPSGGLYTQGTEVTVSATPNSGYRFDSWDGDLTGTSSSMTITMDGNKSVTANFGPVVTHSTVDTTGGTTVLNYDAPQNKYIGNGTLRVSNDGDGAIALGTGGGTIPAEFAMTGGLITIDSGVSLVNGGWSKGIWTNNKADMQVNGTLDVTDGNPVRVNALNGAGPITLSYPWNSRATELHVGVNGGGGTFSGSIQEPHWAGAFVRIVKQGAGTQTFDNLANQKPGEIVLNDGVVNLSSATNATFGANISGAGSLNKTGAGVLTLTGTLTQTGSTTVSEGTLSIGNNFSGNSALVVATGAVLNLNFVGNLTVPSLNLGGSGPLPPGTYNSSHLTYGLYFTGTGTLLISGTDYDTWANTNGVSDGSPEDDPDGDGIKNILEYVLGGDPRKSSTEVLPKATIEGTDLVLTYKRSDASETDTTQAGQWSTNLQTWSDVDVTVELVNENGTAPDDIKIRIPLSKAIGGRLYGRLHVSKP